MLAAKKTVHWNLLFAGTIAPVSREPQSKGLPEDESVSF